MNLTNIVRGIIAAWPQVVKRSLAHWRLLSTVIIGVLLASIIMAGTVIYFDSLRELALKNTLAKLTTNETNILIKSDRGPTTFAEYDKVRRVMEREFDARVGSFLRDRIRGGRSSTFFLTEPGRESEAGEDNSRGFFVFSPRLTDHITLLPGGRTPQPQALSPPGEPLILEAIIPVDEAEEFGVSVGERLSLVPFWTDKIPFSQVIISGLFERNDPANEYWHLDDKLFQAATSTNFTSVSFYVSEETFMNVVGGAFRNMDSTYGWLLAVDTSAINARNASSAQFGISVMERLLSTDLFSYRQITSLEDALAEFDERLFFSKLPMFVILILIAVVILYYVVTLSSLLVEQQRGEIALLRSRGASSAQVLIVYILEGGTISILAIVAAPILAALAISLLGFAPVFSDLSGGGRLSVNLSTGAYLMSALGGLFSFVALMIPAVQASRVSVTKYRQELARPTGETFFQRYYLDIMLLVISAILFRQLDDQGSVVAIGVFGDVAVNQVLLAVPAVSLLAFALVGLRLFPLAIRYLSGDSPALVHLIVGVTVLILAPSIAIRGAFEGNGITWLAQVGLLIALAAVYWATTRVGSHPIRFVGMALEAGAVAGVLLIGPTLPLQDVFIHWILIAIVPAQIVYILLYSFAHRAPVGYSMGMWQMARNPTHYARLSLLLILTAGLGIFAASFGGTLERSFEDRALYSTGSDIRIEGLLLNNFGRTQPIESTYTDIPGVDAVSPVLRRFGSDLSKLLGKQYMMLAIDNEAFEQIAWFRDDFTARPVPELLDMITHPAPPEGIELPREASSIGVTLDPDRAHPSVAVTMRIKDGNDRYFTYFLGALNSSDSMRLQTTLERRSRFRGRRTPLMPVEPLTLTALSFHETNGRARLRAGSVTIDEIWVRAADGSTQVIESFDDMSQWNTLRVAAESVSDVFGPSQIALNGEADSAALFVWGEGSPLTSRGIFHGPEVTPLPVLASDRFLDETGHSLGESFNVSVAGHRVSVELVDTIDFFPTLDVFDELFLIADLASLSSYANLETTSSELRPNEIWLATQSEGEDRQQLLTALEDEDIFSNRFITDRSEVLADSKVDPLVKAGWRALLFLAFASVLILSALGFLVHAYVSFQDREMQFALMRTIGFTMKQLITLVWIEQALVIAAGMGLGTWMGGRLGAIIMPFLGHDDRGSQVLPPFKLEINWVTLGITYAIMLVAFALIIMGVIWFIRRISLQRILRLGEN